MDGSCYQTLKWPARGGGLVTCTEKLKVLNDNLNEVRTVLQDALDDAVLMGCDEAAARAQFSEVCHSLHSFYNANKADNAGNADKASKASDTPVKM